MKRKLVDKKIFVRITGGVGNQLFAYAAARRLAKVNNAELIIDDISGFEYDVEYRRIFQLDKFNISSRRLSFMSEFQPQGRIQRWLLREFNNLLPFDFRNYITQNSVDFDSSLLTLRTGKCAYIEGYWQSELYFKDIESQIRKDLTFKLEIDSVNTILGAKISNPNSVVVHVRFFDEPINIKAKSVNNVSRDYYDNAIKLMESKLDDAHYYIFSDRPEYAHDLIPLEKSRVTIVHHNIGEEFACFDLWLMSQCKNFIIANSTFSWWGAWLSEKANKIIVAPAVDLDGKIHGSVTSWGFEGLLPSDWILI